MNLKSSQNSSQGAEETGRTILRATGNNIYKGVGNRQLEEGAEFKRILTDRRIWQQATE